MCDYNNLICSELDDSKKTKEIWIMIGWYTVLYLYNVICPVIVLLHCLVYKLLTQALDNYLELMLGI